MHKLPIILAEFIPWLIIGVPKYIFIVSKRILALVNNELGVTLNYKLLLTPIFGDYTVAGRFIGFFFRLFQVVIGTVFIFLLAAITTVSPLIWWAIPIAGIKYAGLKFLVFYIFVFLFYFRYKVNTPLKPVNRIKNGNPADALRINAEIHYREFLRNNTGYISVLLKDPLIKAMLTRAELTNEILCRKEINSAFCQISADFIQKISAAPAIPSDTILRDAFDYALKHKSKYIETEHIFLAILKNIPKISQLLTTYGSSLESLESVAEWFVTEREEKSRRHFWQPDYIMPLMGGIGKAMTGRVTPLLDSFSQDFTKMAQKGFIHPVVGREKEYQKIAEILSGPNKNVLLIGEPGSGKTSIVKGMAYKIMRGVEFPALKFKRLVSLDVNALIAGTKTKGEIAQRIKNVMKEVNTSGDIILFIDEIHNLVTGTLENDQDAASVFSLLESHLSSHVQFIGATNLQNYRKYIEPNGSFARLFKTIEIEPSSKEESLEILKNRTKSIEKELGITITYPALIRVIELSEKLIHQRVLPDKALDILKRTASSQARTNKYLTTTDIAEEISAVTHVPVTKITEDESQKLLNIESELKKQVVGQDEAIKQVSSALKRARTGLRNENRPIASFLFVGTTGVGKTETAKALARLYFGDEKNMIRLDMSEYQQLDSINRLIGTPDGKSKGILTEQVRTKPFTLVLLDEIEKAAPNILLTFLQVLDDARLTDSNGVITDFTNTIIIATSNVGTKNIQEVATRGGDFTEINMIAMEEVKHHFAPEFLNRFNGIVVYKPLDVFSMKKIADLTLNRVKSEAHEKGIDVSFKAELKDELVKRGYSPEWGARPLSRLVEETVETYLAEQILSKNVKEGDSIEIGTEVF